MPTTKYLWDDESDTVVMEKNGLGNTTAVYHTDPGQFGKLVSQRRGGKTYDYHYDAQGNTRTLSDGDGKITDSYRYDAWGNQRAKTGTTENPYRFGGQFGYQYNETTADQYVRERLYAPKQGRWRNEDPSRFQFNNQLFIYVHNRPTNAVDPSALADLVLNIKKPDSMPWSSETLPGRFANTLYRERITIKYFRR